MELTHPLMESSLQLLALILICLVIAVPVLAIAAFVRAGSIQKMTEQIPRLISRIWDLERQIKAIDQKLSALATGAPPSSTGHEVQSSLHVSRAEDVGSTESIRGRTPAFAQRSDAHITGAEILSKPMQPSPPAFPDQPPKPTSAPQAVHAMVSAPPQTAALKTPEGLHVPVPAQTQGAGFTAGATPPGAPPATPPHYISASPLPPSRPDDESDVESMLAGRWFNYVGILAVGLAATFFLKYAFDNDWIGPGGRVTIGLLVGAAMYPLSQWIYNRGYEYYSEGLAGLGAGVLYLSVWAGWHYYHVFPQTIAFPLMIAITAATVGLAYGRNSERIAVLALIGGLLTPILVSTGANEEFALFSYVLVLGGGMLAIAWVKRWKSIVPLQFAGTLIYFWGWYGDYYGRYELGTTLVFATLFFVLFAALPAVRCTQEGELPPLDITIVLTNAFQFLVALHLMLWPDYKWALTFAVLALAAGHLLTERALPPKDTAANRLVHSLYAGLALVFVTLAIPIRLEGKWITIAFAVEGALLIWTGLKEVSAALRTVGCVLFGIVAIRLFILTASSSTPDTFLLNERFLTMVIAAVCWLAAFLMAQQSDCELGEAETRVYQGLAVAANFLIFVALSMDVWDLFGRTAVGIDRALAQQMALSVLWIGYALVLIVIGMWQKSAGIRWQGLGLLCVAIGKVFFLDLSFLTRFYRIVSFFALGLVLLLVSFYYQKRANEPRGSKQS